MASGGRHFPFRRCRSNAPALVKVWWHPEQCAAANPVHFAPQQLAWIISGMVVSDL
jgi:hypothetical protein